MKEEITPLVGGFTGIIDVADKDYKEDYLDYLTEKYS